MRINIQTHLSYDFPEPTDVLLQIELARIAGQDIKEDALLTTPVNDFSRVAGEQAIGVRARMQAEGLVDITYRATVEVTRPNPDLASLTAVTPRFLTAEAMSFLMPSRYCPSDEFQTFVLAEFNDLSGGPLILAMRNWIRENFTYDSEISSASTTARESFVQRRGVCRDYAHVLITFARAAGIPARMASVYAPDVDPPDFHAVAEVWLSDAWHLVDATGMAEASEIAVIGVGRDAADVSFLASFGLASLNAQTVKVTRA